MPLKAPKGFIDESDPRVCLIGHPAPPWLVNYADLMTELVCFFVILYALSAALNKDMQKAKEEIQASQTPGVSAEVTKDGLKITFEEMKDTAFFESGSAELTPDMERLMMMVTPKLQKLLEKHDLIVEGHTDNLPIKNDLYLSNWELSSARATNVVEFLIKNAGLPAGQLAATGFGEHRPIATNDTAEHRRKNRRVVFLVKSSPSAGAKAASAKTAAAPKPESPTPLNPGETPEGAQAEGETAEVGTVGGDGNSGIFDSVLSRIRGK